jgi:hypothetical protein
MRIFLSLFILAMGIASCSEKASLNDDDERYIEITLAMMKTRAKVVQAGADSLQLRRSLDSVYRAFKIDSTEYVRMSVELAERPDHALLAYQTIRDSLGLK